MFKIYKLIGMVILAMAMPICLLAKPVQDTLVYLSDGNGKPIDSKVSAYITRKWKEGNQWHVQNLFYPETIPHFEGFFSDSECTKRTGTFIYFYPNGLMQDSGRYSNNKPDGYYYGWYDEGQPNYIRHYTEGILTDTSIDWYKTGKKSRLVELDKAGNGILDQYYENGIKSGTGNLHLGKREGMWTFKDENNITSQKVNYQLDSAISIINYDQTGVQEAGINLQEKVPEFPNGLSGWRRFLERNLQYPERSQRKGIQGVIRISLTIDKEGNVSDYKVLGNPDKDLAKEALRIMSISPKWIPAIQHNRKVTYRFVQSITFLLQ